MKKLKLIAIHLKKPEFTYCSYCDGQTLDVLKYYVPAEELPHLIRWHRYLDCCVKKVGVVVDWREE